MKTTGITKNLRNRSKALFETICGDVIAEAMKENFKLDVIVWLNNKSESDYIKIEKAYKTTQENQTQNIKFAKDLKKYLENFNTKTQTTIINFLDYYLAELDGVYKSKKYKTDGSKHTNFNFSEEALKYKSNNDSRPVKDKNYYSYHHDSF